MNKQERYTLYSGRVLPGWWWLLDEHVLRCREIDPKCMFDIKQKYGGLRFFTYSEDYSFGGIEAEAEMTSVSVCEYCGAPGEIRTDHRYIETLCDRCASIRMNPAEKREIITETEQRWLNEEE